MSIRVTLKIKNSIKPHRVQHILRPFYYTPIQKLCTFEAENHYKCHKDSPLRE